MCRIFGGTVNFCIFGAMNTFTQQYIMAVFSVKYRLGLIDPRWAENLYAIMGKILKDIDGVVPLKIRGAEVKNKRVPARGRYA